jgi:hypothetical protein
MAKTVKSKRFKLTNVRLSFPSLYERAKMANDSGPGKYEATFLLPKSDKKQFQMIKKIAEAAIAEAAIKVPKDKWCIKDGDEVEYDGYADHWSIKASTKKRPQTFDKDLTPLDSEDEKFYPGCWVNCSLDFWVQNNEFGKRLNCNLYGVQFAKDGEEFGDSVDVSDDFDAVDSDDDYFADETDDL